MRVQIQYPLPPSLNVAITAARTHWRKYSDLKREWTEIVLDESEGCPTFPRNAKVWVEAYWFVPHKGCDPDNFGAMLKFIMDGLVKGGILEKDSLVIIQQPWLHWFPIQGKEPWFPELIDGAKTGLILHLSTSPLYKFQPIDDA